MSRHEVAGRNPALEITVGWDNPLQTFFGQVLLPGKGEEEDRALLWIGTSWQNCLTPDSLVAPLAPYVTIDEKLLAQLRSDRAEAAQERPSVLHVNMGRLLGAGSRPRPRAR